MVDQALIYSAKMAARITTNYYDVEVERLLNAAMLDMGVAGVVIPEDVDDLVQQAAITYFLMNFGQPDNYDSLKRSYDEQKAQLSTKTGYTQWTEATLSN
jgi:hypothetical protein